jgi:hypothetical protein
MHPLLLLLAPLVGCTDPDACKGECEADDPHQGDSGVPPYVQEDPSPELTVDEVGTAIFSAFAFGFPNGKQLKTTYLDMMSNGDEACPNSTTIITQDYILGCVAGSGYYYSGVCVYTEDTFVDETGTTQVWALGGDFDLAYPSGDHFAAGGGATYTGVRATDGEESFTSNVRGTWYDESATNWLGQGISALIDYTGGKTAGKPWIMLHGGIGIGDVDLFFDDMTWDWGSTCNGSPVGELRLRDSRGYWYVWTLDDDCDTCGELVFHGDTDLGELCVDLTPVGEDAYYSLAVPQ